MASDDPASTSESRARLSAEIETLERAAGLPQTLDHIVELHYRLTVRHLALGNRSIALEYCLKTFGLETGRLLEQTGRFNPVPASPSSSVRAEFPYRSPTGWYDLVEFIGAAKTHEGAIREAQAAAQLLRDLVDRDAADLLQVAIEQTRFAAETAPLNSRVATQLRDMIDLIEAALA